jgi:nitrogen fixation protein NifU and related proteins
VAGARFAILLKMFSETVLDHFKNPRNAGELSGATAVVEVSNPVCGDVLKLFVQVKTGRIHQAKFLCRGCTTSIACASLLTEQLSGRATDELRKLTAEYFANSLGTLPPATFHAAQLAADAVSQLILKLST